MRVRTIKQLEQEKRLERRQPLFEVRGNNPPNLIGYVDTKTQIIYTARGSISEPYHPVRGAYVGGNNKHDRRVMASTKDDFTLYV